MFALVALEKPSVLLLALLVVARFGTPLDHRASTALQKRETKDRNGADAFETVAENWFKRHVEAKGLISSNNIRSYLDGHIIPAWRGRDFASIHRGDVAALLDKIEEKSGPVAADHALAVIRRICNWRALRDEDYSIPVIPGMRRAGSKQRARKRILDDAELREVWRVAEENGTYGAFVRLALLTAQRREKIAAMKWTDIVDGEWHIPSEEKEKGTPPSLTLPQAALDIIKAQPGFASNEYVFAGDGASYMQCYSKRKLAFDAKLKDVAPYVVHDLRRTAKSLMPALVCALISLSAFLVMPSVEWRASMTGTATMPKWNRH